MQRMSGRADTRRGAIQRGGGAGGNPAGGGGGWPFDRAAGGGLGKTAGAAPGAGT
jgi:hypothetical protein